MDKSSLLPPFVLLAILATSPAISRCQADEPPLTVDAVLAKWEKASQECRILDAKLTVFHYDRVFHGDKPCIQTGRFYYEAPNLGRYEVKDRDGDGPRFLSARSEVIVWNGKEMLDIDPTRRTCDRFRIPEAKKAQEVPDYVGLFSFFAFILQRLESPQKFLPLIVDIRAAEVRKRFDITLTKHDANEAFLKAVPKRKSDQACFREIVVILDAKTNLTYAMGIVFPGGTDREVYVLEEQKVNQVPSDRESLIHPDLSRLRVVDVN